MKRSWLSFFRRVAGVCFVQRGLVLGHVLCEGAADTAADPVYADGWQAGDNGGFGFGPWDFTGTYNSPVGQTIDTTSRYNPFQRLRRYTMQTHRLVRVQEPTSLRLGALVPGNLQPGQTVSILLANPLQHRFFRGYTVRFNTGGGNTVFMGTPQSRMAIGVFDYAPRAAIGSRPARAATPT